MYPNCLNYYNTEDFNKMKYENKMKVFGQGIVNVKPDTAELIISIITEGKELEIAQKRNTQISEQVIENVESQGVLQKDIQTQNYSINMQYDYIEGKQVFRGYIITNTLKIMVRDINNVGKVIDAAVEGGANTINNISFTVSDAAKYYNIALKLAIKDSQNKALAIADKLNVNINIVPVQIVEQVSNVATPLMTASFKAAAAPPIEAGENKIVANIEAVFNYYK